MQTRCAICGGGLLLGVILVLAHLPVIVLSVPVAVLFLGLVADPEETHAVWYGMLNTLCVFDFSTLADAEKENYTAKRHYFWFGEVGMAALLAGMFAVPIGCWLAGKTDMSLAFTGSALVFLVLFVFLPKLIRRGMNADTDAAIEAFGRNEHVRNVFWAVFVATASLVLVRILDPDSAQQVIGMITGMGV